MEDRVIPIVSESTVNDSSHDLADVTLRPHGYFSLPDWRPDDLAVLRDAIHNRHADVRVHEGEWTIGAYGLESTTHAHSVEDGVFQPPDRLKDIAYFCSYQSGITRPIVYAASTSVNDLAEWVQRAPLIAETDAHEYERSSG